MGIYISAFALLATTTDGEPTALGGLPNLLVFGAFFVAMYFLLVRPQRKRQAEQQRLLEALTVGQSVITIGGLHGVIDSLTDTTVDLLVDADGTVLRFTRAAIASTAGSSSAEAETVDALDADESDDEA